MIVLQEIYHIRTFTTQQSYESILGLPTELIRSQLGRPTTPSLQRRASVMLYLSCRVLCCSCCVFVRVTCFSSYRRFVKCRGWFFVWSSVVLFLSCRVLCCSCCVFVCDRCVFVCVTCFSSQLSVHTQLVQLVGLRVEYAERGRVPYVGNPGFGIHCHRLDSVNPGFIWRVPLVNPLDSGTGIHKMCQT